MARLELEDDVESMYNAGYVTQHCQEDVDEEIGIAPALQEDTDGRQDNREDDLDDIACRENHLEDSSTRVDLESWCRELAKMFFAVESCRRKLAGGLWWFAVCRSMCFFLVGRLREQ